MEDYSVDSRGDVGSWIREAAVLHLAQILEAYQTLINSTSHVTRFIGKLLQLSVEKLDRLRGICMKVLKSLLTLIPCNSNNIDDVDIDNVDSLRGYLIFDDDYDCERIFNLLVPITDIESFRSFLLVGIISSIGGLSENLANSARKCLFDHLKQSSKAVEIFKDLMQLYLEKRDIRWATAYLVMLDCMMNDMDLSEKFKDLWLQEYIGLFLPKSIGFISGGAMKRDSLSKDVKRLQAVIRVLNDFLFMAAGSCSETLLLKAIFDSIFRFLRHPYPRVRHFAAEQLYLSLVSMECVGFEEMQSELSEYITEIDWLKWDSNARASGRDTYVTGTEYLNHYILEKIQ